MTSPSVDYHLIPLTGGQFAKVDAADYEWLNQWKWQACLSPTTGRYYAVRNTYLKRKHIYFRMHRVILGLMAGDKRQGDHINLDSLDNRRSNLRIASVTENCQNRGVRRNKVSPFKGVCYERRGLKHWRARIRVHGKLISLGCFLTPEEAHDAYIAASEVHFGEFARVR
jgi:hypothetical protein